MARKAYYTNVSAPTESQSNSKGADYAKALHNLADNMASDYADHAIAVRKIARSLSGGQQVIREHRSNQSGSGQKKTNVAQGG